MRRGSKGHKARLLTVLTLGALLITTACATGNDEGEGDAASTATDSDGPLKVGFVHLGPVGDAGWTYAADLGREQLEEELGDAVETVAIENIPEGPESLPTFRDLARDGYDIIFGTTFGYQDQMLEAAEEFPDTIFMNATGFHSADNLGTYQVAAHEASYLAGMAAGHATESKQLGYIAAFPIPEVLRVINAYTLGAQAVDPDIELRVVWTSTWISPPTEKQAAESLLSAGADVVGQYQDTPAAGEAASEVDAKWTGAFADMSNFHEDAWLTGPVRNWGNIYVDTVQAVLDGTWSNEPIYRTMAEDGVDIAPFGESVSEEAQEEILEAQEAIINGELEIFEGPIKDQEGNVVIEEGHIPTIEELDEVDYLIEGIAGRVEAE